MKILFGVQTTGNGYISCSRLLIEALKSAGHHVTTLFSGAPRAGFWDYQAFEPHSDRRGLTFVVEGGQVSYVKTALQTKPLELIRDIRALDLTPYDVVISNFEPITAWAATLQKKPSIGISHQAAFYYDTPKQPGNYFARAVMRWYAPTQFHLGLHWHHFGQPILPPVIEPGLTNSANCDPRLIVVNLPFEDKDEVCKTLAHFSSHQFHFYADVQGIERRGNVTLHPFGRTTFIADLKRCAGVICHAGFELPSEALHLGKKLLVRPVNRQFEQQCNAAALVQNGLGQSMDTLDHHAIRQFLNTDNMAPKKYPNVAAAVAQWIGKTDLHAPNAHRPLVESLWSQTA